MSPLYSNFMMSHPDNGNRYFATVAGGVVRGSGLLPFATALNSGFSNIGTPLTSLPLSVKTRIPPRTLGWLRYCG